LRCAQSNASKPAPDFRVTKHIGSDRFGFRALRLA
jgi:hypothetical protein